MLNILCIIQVYAVASEDMDSLTFGAPKFLRHLMDPSSKKIPVMEFDVAKVCYPWLLSKRMGFSLYDLLISIYLMFQILEELDLTMDQFIDLCILSGCDYCDNIRGIFCPAFIQRVLGSSSILWLWYDRYLYMCIIWIIINVCHRYWGDDSSEAHTPTRLYWKNTGKYKQREVFFFSHFKILCFQVHAIEVFTCFSVMFALHYESDIWPVYLDL